MNQYIVAILLFPRMLWKNWELIWSFVNRDLKARYEGSLLGRLWPVIQPLMIFIIYYAVFAQLLKIPVSVDLKPWGDASLGDKTLFTTEGGWRSVFFLISGILPWIAVSESVIKCSTIVLDNANLIKKIAFPSEFLPIYTVILNHIYFLIGFVIFLVIELCVNGSLPILLLWLPLILILQMLFLMGLGMLVGAMNVFIRDVSQFVSLFTMFWMFISPVFYEPKILAMLGNPSQKSLVEKLIPYLPLNPAYNLLSLYRDIFKFGRHTEIVISQNVLTATTAQGAEINVTEPVWNAASTLGNGISHDCLLIFAVQALLTFVVGYAFFLRAKGRFADEV